MEVRVRPWFVRAVEALPLPLPWTAAAVAAALGAANWVLWRAAGPVPEGFPSELLGYIPLAIAQMLVIAPICLRLAARDLEELRPRLRCSDAEYELLARSQTHYPRGAILGASAVGAFVAAGPLLSPTRAVLGDELAGVTGIELLIPLGGVMILENVLFWVLCIPTVVILVLSAAQFRRLGAEHFAVDLFDRRPLAPFTRVGLRLPLVFLGVIGLRAASYAVSAPRGLVLADFIIMTIFALFATAALLLPTLGVRTSIRVAKRRELERVQEEIDRRRNGSETPIDADEGVPRAVLNLLDYREKVEAVREWPFETTSLLRFLAYLLIPVGGWIGGAFMERWIDRVIG